MAETLISLINVVAQLISLLILARAILSWVQVDREQPIVKFIFDVTEPILAPVRNLLPQAGMMDFSPLVVLLLLQILIVPILTTIVRSLF
jgi:YggT family protein